MAVADEVKSIIKAHLTLKKKDSDVDQVPRTTPVLIKETIYFWQVEFLTFGSIILK